ncbi:hypothetical protein ACSBR2_024945 [Camellia fascicularis]
MYCRIKKSLWRLLQGKTCIWSSRSLTCIWSSRSFVLQWKTSEFKNFHQSSIYANINLHFQFLHKAVTENHREFILHREDGSSTTVSSSSIVRTVRPPHHEFILHRHQATAPP